MKKVFALLSCFILFTAITCENEPIDEGVEAVEPNITCEQASLDLADAALAFTGIIDGNYEELCNNYKTALENFIEACGDPDGTVQQTINALGDCQDPETFDDCDAAENAASLAQINFENATDENYTDLCNIYKSLLEIQIEECGDEDGNLQAIIDDLGDCSDVNQGNEEDIEGTWLLTAWIGEEPIDLNNDGEENINFLLEMNCYNNEFLQFNTDGSGLSTSNSYAEITTELEVGSTNSYDFIIDCITEFEETPFSWVQDSGNNYTITINGEDSDATISGNELSIFVPSGFIAFDSEDLTVTTIQDLTFVYTKQ